MWSNPARLTAPPKKPPPLASPKIPVSGLKVVKVDLDDDGKPVPTRGPAPKIRGLDGSRGDRDG